MGWGPCRPPAAGGSLTVPALEAGVQRRGRGSPAGRGGSRGKQGQGKRHGGHPYDAPRTDWGRWPGRGAVVIRVMLRYHTVDVDAAYLL